MRQVFGQERILHHVIFSVWKYIWSTTINYNYYYYKVEQYRLFFVEIWRDINFYCQLNEFTSFTLCNCSEFNTQWIASFFIIVHCMIVASRTCRWIYNGIIAQNESQPTQTPPSDSTAKFTFRNLSWTGRCLHAKENKWNWKPNNNNKKQHAYHHKISFHTKSFHPSGLATDFVWGHTFHISIH